MSLADDLRKFSDKTGARFSTLRRKLVLDLHADLVAATPVDTGHARANWQVSTGSPAEGIITDTDHAEPIQPGGNGTPPGSTSTTIAASALKHANPAETMYITNNLPYIERLNDGYSDQAPSGMVEVALASAESRLRDELEHLP